MLKARPGKELVLRLADHMETLAQAAKIVAERGVNTLAMCYWKEDTDTVIRLVTDDSLRASEALRENAFDVEIRDVVLVDAAHKPGILRHITDVLAKHDIALSHLFATATIRQEECLIVLHSSNNAHVIVLLNA